MASPTVARPYARALFEYALETKSLVVWSEISAVLSRVVLDKLAADFFSNPASTLSQQKALLMGMFSAKLKEHPALERFVDILVAQGRVGELAMINEQFQALCAEYEKTVVVQVRSFSKLSKKQEQLLSERLSKRLQRQVSLEVTIDASLLGGAVIQAGDFVIDGSVREKLNALYAELVA